MIMNVGSSLSDPCCWPIIKTFIKSADFRNHLILSYIFYLSKVRLFTQALMRNHNLCFVTSVLTAAQTESNLDLQLAHQPAGLLYTPLLFLLLLSYTLLLYFHILVYGPQQSRISEIWPLMWKWLVSFAALAQGKPALSLTAYDGFSVGGGLSDITH